MTSKSELEYLIGIIINCSAKIERIKQTKDDTPLNRATIDKLWRKIYSSKYKLIKLYNIECYER